jgi:hypothetical protein
MIPEEQLAALAAKYPRMKVVRYNGHDLVFRSPTKLDMRPWQIAMQDPSQKPFADDALAQKIVACVDGVDGPAEAVRSAYNALTDLYPLLVNSTGVQDAIAKLTGIVEEDAEKK